jgi:hypothetical protein
MRYETQMAMDIKIKQRDATCFDLLLDPESIGNTFLQNAEHIPEYRA